MIDTRTTRQKIDEIETRLRKGVRATGRSRLMTCFERLQDEKARAEFRRLGDWYSNMALQRAFEAARKVGGTDAQIVVYCGKWLEERYYPARVEERDDAV